MGYTFLTAFWKDLIMANYKIDPAILKPYLPNKTEFDFFSGDAYVSLIGFMFTDTKLRGFKIPYHVNFEEVNLRFYVRYNDNGEWKRGTVFIKEIVPKRAISIVANTIYHEKYVTKPMKHVIHQTTDGLSFCYQWMHNKRLNKIEAVTEINAKHLVHGSEEEFIAEHYWGYSKYNAETTFEYSVQHPPWKIFPVKTYTIDCDFGSLYGNEFSFLAKKEPDSVFVAEGSAIEILRKRKL